MSTKRKKPYSTFPSVVSKFLATKFQRSTSYPSQIRGVHNQSSGFQVWTGPSGTTVGYVSSWSSIANGTERSRVRIQMVKRYAELLRTRYEVTSYTDHLIVKEKADG